MCPHESPGRLLESVSNYRSRWMVISLAIARQNPAYRATLLYIKGVGGKTPLPFPFYALYLLSRPNAILCSCMGESWASMGNLMGKFVLSYIDFRIDK